MIKQIGRLDLDFAIFPTIIFSLFQDSSQGAIMFGLPVSLNFYNWRHSSKLWLIYETLIILTVPIKYFVLCSLLLLCGYCFMIGLGFCFWGQKIRWQRGSPLLIKGAGHHPSVTSLGMLMLHAEWLTVVSGRFWTAKLLRKTHTSFISSGSWG
jgi:hypothetical protein